MAPKREMTEAQLANLARARELAVAARKRKGLAGAKEIVFVKEEPLEEAIEEPEVVPELPVVEPELPVIEPVVEPEPAPKPVKKAAKPKVVKPKAAPALPKNVINILDSVQEAPSTSGVDKSIMEKFYQTRTRAAEAEAAYYELKQKKLAEPAPPPPPPPVPQMPAMTDEEAALLIARNTFNKKMMSEFQRMAMNTF